MPNIDVACNLTAGPTVREIRPVESHEPCPVATV